MSLSEQEMAELSALADGSLPAERRAEVEARIAASPELLELVERQRQAVAATSALTGEAPPVRVPAYDRAVPDDESKQERLNRELIQLLNELRVALPGVQVLLSRR
jgi:anti-sigma factor RsiW